MKKKLALLLVAVMAISLTACGGSKPAETQAPAAPAPTAPAKEIFTLKSEAKLAPKVNVLGKIDLSALNQSTRPKKKTKEKSASSVMRKLRSSVPPADRPARRNASAYALIR